MNRCRICGRSFDPLGFQVLVPGLSEGFDRVECAEKARAANRILLTFDLGEYQWPRRSLNARENADKTML